jgi:UDP-N-acetyl-D-mannosaminuronic acid transferase (WecB/TagA/CpsF family)
MTRIETILGVRFLNAPVEVAIEALASGGLMIVPSAPALTLLRTSPAYRDAAVGCDFAIVDSAYLALLWWALHRQRLHRVSGLGFLRAFLREPSVRRPGALFLVNPSEQDAVANLRYLREQGIELTPDDCYTAPEYVGNYADPVLRARLDTRRPRYIMLNIGGGVQEPLGLYLKNALAYRPGILCTGAAIAFLTGRQARIPVWVDALGLGWLARTLGDPRRFGRRYLGAFQLAKLVIEYGRDLPPLVSASRS